MNLLSRILVPLGSSISIAFGVWHFFVPRAWNWWSYIEPKATELVAAVRAINVFFSLSLVLFGALNLIFVLSGKANRYSILVLLAATCVLWITRVAMQIVFPQGSMNSALQYGMLVAFVVAATCYLIPFFSELFTKVI